MKTINIEKDKKKTYEAPKIERVILDNEISLVLMSPDTEPYHASNESGTMNNDPFKTSIG